MEKIVVVTLAVEVPHEGYQEPHTELFLWGGRESLDDIVLRIFRTISMNHQILEILDQTSWAYDHKVFASVTGFNVSLHIQKSICVGLKKYFKQARIPLVNDWVN